jgi:hypothetical protein
MELGNATYIADIVAADTGNKPGVKGYKFQSKGHLVWILWSSDGKTHLINWSSAPLRVWDAMGVSIHPSVSMEISSKPLYLEWGQ